MSVSLFSRIELQTFNKLTCTLLFTSVLISSQVLAEEEAAVSADVPVSKQELMQQAADGEVSVPRVRKFAKPNRMLMHASVVNTKAGISFLDENSRKPGVIKLKSGLQYKVVKAGTGAKPKEEDVVKCAYKGALIDGTVFEQSEQGKPASIKVAPLTAGLKEAIKLMPVGSKWEVYIPSELGFGSAGKAPKVGPDAVLVYNLELLDINPATSK
jgi:FKBP-type peptidyl-prolyl cis-trans isomerase FklB